jgi:hypothetical protein
MVLLLPFWSPQARGCKCVEMSLEQRLEQAQFVVVADVVLAHENPDVRGTARLRVVRSLKGDLAVGSNVSFDPFSGTSCAGATPPRSRLLIFGWDGDLSQLKASKCSIFAVQPFEVDGVVYQPAADVVEFVRER